MIMRRFLQLATWLAAGGAAAMAVAAGNSAPDTAAEYAKSVTPLLKKYCYECHGDGKHKGKLALDAYKTVADVETNRGAGEDVLRNVRSSEMPPPADTKVQPSLPEREIISAWIEKE